MDLEDKKLTFWTMLCTVTSADGREIVGNKAGRVPEWSKGTDCKSVVRKPTVGSNPTAAFRMNRSG